MKKEIKKYTKEEELIIRKLFNSIKNNQIKLPNMFHSTAIRILKNTEFDPLKDDFKLFFEGNIFSNCIFVENMEKNKNKDYEISIYIGDFAPLSGFGGYTDIILNEINGEIKILDQKSKITVMS